MSCFAGFERYSAAGKQQPRGLSYSWISLEQRGQQTSVVDPLHNLPQRHHVEPLAVAPRGNRCVGMAKQLGDPNLLHTGVLELGSNAVAEPLNRRLTVPPFLLP